MVHRELSPSFSKKALPKAGLSHFWAWAIGRLSRHRIAGRSMMPTLHEDWVVLVDPRAYDTARIELGDVVLARFVGQSTHPCVKRVTAIDGEKVTLRGDNPQESTDSTTLGSVESTDVLGKVVCTFP
ncbi:MAG: nickel-type superoxide dismutase maturation protease [Myxococcota bacterium]|nr:nickel-type superoxide dismutase maturation protease [Myxococcota bacterium]